MSADRLSYQALVEHQVDIADAAAAMFAGGGRVIASDWASISVPESAGGADGEMIDLAIFTEACGAGTSASDVPWTTGVAAQALLATDDSPGELISAIAAGISHACIPALQLDHDGAIFGPLAADGIVNGSVVSLGKHDATLVLPVSISGRTGLALVDSDHPGVTVEQLLAMDTSRPWSRFHFDAVPIAGLPVYFSANTFDHWRILVGTYSGLDAAGAARTALASTIEYAKVRQQFGRPIGSFQAYKHACATAFIDLKLAQSVAFRAAKSIDGPEAARYAYASAIEATAAATRVCMAAIQLHGGIGFSAESGVHRYLRRTRADEIIAGRTQSSKALAGVFGPLPAPASAGTA